MLLQLAAPSLIKKNYMMKRWPPTASKTGKYVAPPSCNAPHVRGVAIDVCVKGTLSCSKISPKTPDIRANVTLLQAIMKEAGWKMIFAANGGIFNIMPETQSLLFALINNQTAKGHTDIAQPLSSPIHRLVGEFIKPRH